MPLTTSITSPDSPAGFAGLLRFWRNVHEVSQEALAFQIGSSPRHISRLENGHVRPSSEMVQKIAASLGLLDRDTQHLLIAAGFVPQPPAQDFQAAELHWLRKAMTRTLQALDPHPTVLINPAGDLLMVNRSWVNFMTCYFAEALPSVINHFDFLFSLFGPDDAPPAWQDAIALILMSMQQEVLLRPPATAVAAKLTQLQAAVGVPANWAQRAARLEPMASFKLPVPLNSAVEPFLHVSQNVGALGPTAFVSEPRLILYTLYLQDGHRAVSDHASTSTPLAHPLLPY